MQRRLLMRLFPNLKAINAKSRGIVDWGLPIWKMPFRLKGLLPDTWGINGISSILLERNGWGIALNDVRLGKVNCLLRITRRMGLKPEEVIAIGDSNNDRTMLDGKIGFFPASAANADEEIKRILQNNHGIIAEQSYGVRVAEIIDRTFRT